MPPESAALHLALSLLELKLLQIALLLLFLAQYLLTERLVQRRLRWCTHTQQQGRQQRTRQTITTRYSAERIRHSTPCNQLA